MEFFNSALVTVLVTALVLKEQFCSLRNRGWLRRMSYSHKIISTKSSPYLYELRDRTLSL